MHKIIHLVVKIKIMEIDNLSIRARVGLGVFVLEHLLERIQSFNDAKMILIEKIWCFPKGENIENWLEEFVEYLPNVILNEDYDHEDSYDFLTYDEHKSLRTLYVNSDNIIITTIESIFEIVNVHIYSSIVNKGSESLIEINKILNLADKSNLDIYIKNNKILSIKNDNGWGETFNQVTLKSILKIR